MVFILVLVYFYFYFYFSFQLCGLVFFIRLLLSSRRRDLSFVLTLFLAGSLDFGVSPAIRTDYGLWYFFLV